MGQIKVLGICGSLRRQSTNYGLLKYAQENAPAGLEVKLADLSLVPLYNEDLQEVPTSAQKLMDDIKWADALLLACPEYNYSIAPALKNALDWASRAPEITCWTVKLQQFLALEVAWVRGEHSIIFARYVYFSICTCSISRKSSVMLSMAVLIVKGR